MENPEEILHSLEEFSKLKPKDIPRELEDYLCFVAKTGDPVYQWATIKSLFREKLINVITDFYESCPSIDIPPCPNVEVFNYESMKTFILEKLDTFAAAPFTVQRICELLTSPRKEYNRIDKYMRALEKNILVVSTTEPGFRRTTENGEGIVNGLECEHVPENNNTNNDINVEEMDDTPIWSRVSHETVAFQTTENNVNIELQSVQSGDIVHAAFSTELRTTESNCPSLIDSVITCRSSDEQPYVSIEPVASDSCLREDNVPESDVTVTITAIPAAVQKRRDSIEPVVSSGDENAEQANEFINTDSKEEEEPHETNSATETGLQENLTSEADATVVEDAVISIRTPILSEKEEIEANVDYSSCEPIQSTNSDQELIQIPIISEVIVSTNSEEIVDTKEQHEEESITSKVSDEILLETTDDISTTVTSTDTTVESPTVICENSLVTSRESSVSSTDDISNDGSNINTLNDSQDVEPSNDVQRFYEILDGDTLADSIVESNSNSEDSNVEEKEEESLKEIQEFASSSTVHDSMDIDLGEESCQEAPIALG